MCKHLSSIFIISFIHFAVYLKTGAATCICADKSLCKAIEVPPRQEVYGFSTNTQNWRHWDWDKLTTVSLFGNWDAELLCHAHSKACLET